MKINVELIGKRAIMFDRFSGDLKSKLKPDEMFYFDGSSKKLVMPTINVLSLLAAENGKSAVKSLGREGKKVGQYLLSSLTITDVDGNIDSLKFLNDKDEQILFSGFANDFEIKKHVARLNKGIPNPKERPIYKGVWKIKMVCHLIDEKNIKVKTLENLFDEASRIGLGTFRPVYGQFEVSRFEIEK